MIGVVSDTHVPDRVKNLHPALIPGLRKAAVQLILHAGDICEDSVLRAMEPIAPVVAVQGNRDFLMNGNRDHKNKESIDVRGVKIGLMHGHVGLWRYITEKFEMMLQGYRFSNYARLTIKTFPSANVIIYGHTHMPENVKTSGKLIMNPGSAGMGGWGFPPSYGLIRIDEGGNCEGEIVQLTGATRRNGNWVQN